MFEATQGESTGESAQAADGLESELAQVVALARAGDGLAFRSLFLKYNGQICTYLAQLYAIRTSDDTTLWHKGFGDSRLYGLSAVNNGTLYFAVTTVISSSMSLVGTGQHVTPTPTISTSAPSADVYALNASDGSQRWHLQPTNNNGYTSGVLAMGGSAYLSIGGHLFALAGKDGGQLWMALNAPTLGTPVAG